MWRILERVLQQSGMDPFATFDRLFAAARAAGVAQPEAMALATVDDNGAPSLRHVLLKSADSAGFVFFTNLGSRKARHIAEGSRVALCFLWRETETQITVDGHALEVSTADADAYWRTRPRESQLAAWASQQSRPIDSREELLAAYEEARLRFAPPRFLGDEVPRPAFWSGFRVVPAHIEFWHGAPHRLHDRLLCTRAGDGWQVARLSP